MSCVRDEASRRRALAWNLALIADYEADQLRVREADPPHVRAPDEIRAECDRYRRDAHRAWGFSCPDEPPAP
jgi:hypothetical protein